jgi:hypothetical protein
MRQLSLTNLCKFTKLIREINIILVTNSNLPIYGCKLRTLIDKIPLYSYSTIYSFPSKSLKKTTHSDRNICILIQYVLLTLISSITNQLNSILVIFKPLLTYLTHLTYLKHSKLPFFCLFCFLFFIFYFFAQNSNTKQQKGIKNTRLTPHPS